MASISCGSRSLAHASKSDRRDRPKPYRLIGGICGIWSDYWRVLLCTDPTMKIISQDAGTRSSREKVRRDTHKFASYSDISSRANLRAGRHRESSTINGCLTMIRWAWLTGRPCRNPTGRLWPHQLFSNAEKFHRTSIPEPAIGLVPKVWAPVQGVRLTNAQEEWLSSI